MIRLFRWLIWGDAHAHRWETIGTHEVFEGYSKTGRPSGTRHILRCTVCGDIKKRDCI